MPSVRKYLELDVDPQQLAKYLIDVLTLMKAKIDTSTSNFVRAVHGSYNAFHPRNAKKRIEIVVRSSMGKAIVEMLIDYTSYMIYAVASIITCFVIGAILLIQACSALEYLSALQHNPFIVFVKDKPWLLKILLNYFNDIANVKLFLEYIEIVSIGLLASGIVGIVYIAIIPASINSFANDIVAKILAYAKEISEGIPSYRPPYEEKELARIEGATTKICSVTCDKTSENTILCSIIGENLSLEHIKKVLEFMGFRVVESSSGIIMGENMGAILAINSSLRRCGLEQSLQTGIG